MRAVMGGCRVPSLAGRIFSVGVHGAARFVVWAGSRFGNWAFVYSRNATVAMATKI